MAENVECSNLATMLERTSLCVSGPTPGVPSHRGDEGFRENVRQHYSIAENNAVEMLVHLKEELRRATTYDFWRLLMEGMTSITGGQYGFVAKRILVDDQDSAVEMPPIGEPGSCLLGVAFYYNDGEKVQGLHRDYKYLAYGAPCHHMKHDKVFLIPNNLPKFITNNPNSFPFPTEAYLGVPLFAEGKCFAHFGLMWTAQALEKLDLGWAFIEMLLHSLEDMINERLVEGESFRKLMDEDKVIPHEAVTAAQSLKPYARSLSHELRTPMQGVVGMLDVMHATVQESLEGQSDAVVRKVLKTLRDNIEVVQDSSRRAVEAADNVVHAYDLNMQVPDTPIPPNDDESLDAHLSPSTAEKRPGIVIEGNSIFFKRSKRRRHASSECNAEPAAKHRILPSKKSPHRNISPRTASLRSAVEETDDILGGSSKTSEVNPPGMLYPESTSENESVPTPGLRHTRIRELLHLIVNESLRVGGRPDSAVAEDTENGEIIEVRSKSAEGNARCKIIEWSVSPQVPETIFVDERDLAKLVSCVFLNAIKFTEHGKVSLNAGLSPRSRYIVISVLDTGPGIPPAFQPYLFKPFSREDDSLTRQKEGLGLGLLVAKGLARRIGGDLVCVRSDVTGPNRGSEFELRVPISLTDVNSGSNTPARTPSRSRASMEEDLPTPYRFGRYRSPVEQKRPPRQRKTASVSKTPEPTPIAKATPPLLPSSLSRRNSLSQRSSPPHRRPSTKKVPTHDRNLAKRYPLTFLVAEDNKINRKLLINMLSKLGYTTVYEAHNGAEAVHQMSIDRAARNEKPIDVILMDLWMPTMDGYQATEKILAMEKEKREKTMDREDDDDRARRKPGVTVLAVSADVTDSALERASKVGMDGYMTKPYTLLDLQRLIVEHCAEDSGVK